MARGGGGVGGDGAADLQSEREGWECRGPWAPPAGENLDAEGKVSRAGGRTRKGIRPRGKGRERSAEEEEVEARPGLGPSTSPDLGEERIGGRGGARGAWEEEERAETSGGRGHPAGGRTHASLMNYVEGKFRV